MSTEKLFGEFYKEDTSEVAVKPQKKRIPIVEKKEKKGFFGFLSRLRPSYWLRRLPLSKKLYYYTVLGLILLIGGGIFAFQIIYPHKGEAAWFNLNWLYRKAINITAHTSGENYVYIELTGSNAIDSSDTTKFQSDCGDLRFTDASGNLLPYYIVSGCGTSTTVVDINLKVFPAGAQTFYYYYGNSQAPNGFSKQGFPKAATNYTIGSIGSEENGPGPVAYWKLDDGQGTVANDSTTGGSAATLTGSTLPVWTTNQCVSNSCLFFNGLSSNATVANTVANVKTITFWVNPAASASAEMLSLNSIVDIRSNGVGSVSARFVTNPTIYVNGIQNSNSGQVATVAANTWNFVTITTSTGISASAIKLGKGPVGVLKGFLDEVRLYNYVRTPAQIQTDMAARGGKGGASAVLGAQDQSFLSSGLVGYWKMDETAANQCSGGSNDSCDSTGNGLDGAWNGDVAASLSAKFAAGTTYDGTGDFTSVAQTPLLKPTDALTVSVWVKASPAGTANERILSYSSTPNIGYGLVVLGNGTVQWIAAVNGTLTENITGTTAINDNTWHHVTGTWDGQLLREYIDGRLEATRVTPTGSIAYGNVNFTIGGTNNGGSNLFTGVLDELRVYKRALSAIEIENLYSFAPGPAARWSFEENQGSIAKDVSGSNNTGTLSNGTIWALGKYGSGIQTDESDGSVVTVADSNSLDPTSLTMSAWVKILKTPSGSTAIMDKGSAYQFAVSASRSLFLTLFNGASNTINGNTNLALNRWYYVTATYDGINANIYINGVLDKTQSLGGSLTNSSTAFKIGQNNGTGRTLSAIIDEVAIYNYPRSQSQIIQDMNAGHSNVGNNMPLGYWRFDAGFGNVASNSGSLAGAAQGRMFGFANPPSSISGWSQDGKFGKSLNFDGTTNLIDVGSDAGFDDMAGFSLSAWINPRTIGEGSAGRIFDKANATTPTNGWNLQLTATNAIKFTVDYSTTDLVRTTRNNAVSLSNWQHVVMTWDGSSAAANVHIYVNGIEMSYQTTTNASGTRNSDAAESLMIGNDKTRATTFDGWIDEAKVYNYPLLQQDVKIDSNFGSSLVLGAFGMSSTGVASNSANAVYCVPGDTTQACSPVGEWNFEEGQGNRVNDSTGGGANGAWAGTGQRWGVGRFGKGGIFNNADTSVNTGGAFDFTSGQSFSTAAWIKTSYLSPSGNNTYSIVSKGCGFTGTYSLWYRASTSLADGRFCLHDSGGTQISAISTNPPLNDNNWHYLVGTRDVTADTVNIYIDGILRNSINDTTTGNFARGNAVILGARGVDFAEHFQGTIDQAQVYNYALTPAQVAWNYNHGKPLVQYKFDECQGSAIHDSAVGTASATLFTGSGGTQTAAGTCTTSGTAWGNGTSGKFNSSINLDGTDDQVTLPPSLNFWYNQMTWSVWAKFTSAAIKPILEMGNGTNGAWLGTWTSNRIAVGFPGVDNVVTTTSVVAGQWYNIVYVRDKGATGANKSKIYINGKEAIYASDSGSDITGNNATGGGRIGTSLDSNDFGVGTYFNGQVDDVQVFNYNLTPVQIRNLYNQSAAVRFGPVTGTP